MNGAIIILPLLLASDGFYVDTDTAGGDFGGGDIVNLDDIYNTPMASDAAAAPSTAIGTKPPYLAIGATNDDGGSGCQVAASGANSITGLTRAAISEGATITIVSVNNECAKTSTTITEGDGTAGTWEGNGAATDIVAACNLYAVLAAAATSGFFGVSRTDATCSDEALLIYSPAGTSVYVSMATSDTDIALTRGTDGTWKNGHTSAAFNGARLGFDEDLDSYLACSSDDVCAAYVGGTKVLDLTTAGAITAGRAVMTGAVSDADGACNVANGATLTGLTWTAVSGTRYTFRITGEYESAATTTGLGIMWSSPAVSSLSMGCRTWGNTGSLIGMGQTAAGAAVCSATTSSRGAGAGGLVVCDGVVTPSASGAVVLKVLTEIDTSSVTINAGTTIEWSPL